MYLYLVPYTGYSKPDGSLDEIGERKRSEEFLDLNIVASKFFLENALLPDYPRPTPTFKC